MEFSEAPIFTKRVQQILTDAEYGLLQIELIKRPDAGSLIQGAGGLRKLRWSIEGKGKRGGARVIYYWYVAKELIYMVYVYKKSEQEDLTTGQLKVLSAYVKKGIL